MKVAVYTIALNEEKFVEGWAKAVEQADVMLVADTGSTDRTVEACRDYGIRCPEISVKPWRFDDARNAALCMIPADIDYCVVLDMDERLAPGWREELERCHAIGFTRLRYRYVWSHNADGSDGLQFYRDGLHARHGYRWKHPVHEVLTVDRIKEVLLVSDLTVHHYPDSTKSRAQYLDILAQSVLEDPHDDRNAYYYARELYFRGKTEQAAAEFKRHLALPKALWKPERAASYRHLAKTEPQHAERWLQKAIEEAPDRREAYVELARFYYEHNEWSQCLTTALDALNIETRPLEYLCEDFAWGHEPWDYAAIASYRIGFFSNAKKYGEKALEFSPNDDRLKANMDFYMEKLKK